jgi:hypothetical protein
LTRNYICIKLFIKPTVRLFAPASSRTFSQAHIADLIAEKRAQGWEFVFLAANQDAIDSATRLSIPAADARSFACTPAGARSSFREMDELVRLKRGK